ncbi:hypothetical protein SEA_REDWATTLEHOG_174 [Gordonia phage RedWattleHog]|uniref:Uncharacterized protein n=1 Tax=Gordonia phage Stormageddon TaxID=2656541 RepID=A0A649VSQ2_9CAUD|nr:hypothetical protein KHQ86_gp125 [Gordonia phage Stormageddon]QGJ95035.1 hypothetical protein SEA_STORMAGEDDON_175 [Gordonia phage Stormageddon]QLF83677.1 hypothetical protein SEA_REDWATTLEHOG_174 [Gordonia phage RedWattleHog]
MRRKTFPAQYPGTCNACGDRFPEDTQISYDDTDRTVHADADECGVAPAPSRLRMPGVCPECNLMHAGEC